MAEVMGDADVAADYRKIRQSGKKAAERAFVERRVLHSKTRRETDSGLLWTAATSINCWANGGAIKSALTATFQQTDPRRHLRIAVEVQFSDGLPRPIAQAASVLRID